MRKATTDKLIADIKEHKYTVLRANLEEIRGRLQGFVPHRPDIQEEVMAGMDIESIFARQGIVDIERLQLLLNFTVKQILQFEAPIKNAETRAWHSTVEGRLAGGAPIEDVIPGVLQWLFDRLEELQLDIANAHVDLMRQRITPEVATAYEQEQVLEAVKSGALKLDRTTAWIEEHTKGLQQKGRPVSVESVVACGILQLMENDRALALEDLPETLVHDVPRINELLGSMQQMVVAEVILLSVRRLLSMHLKELEQPMQEAKRAVAQMLSDKPHSQIDEALKQHVEKAIMQKLSDEEARLLSKMVEKSVLASDPVRSLIKRRVLGVVRQQVQLAAESNTSTTSGESIEKQCIRDDDLRALCDQLISLLSHLNRAFRPIHQLIMSTMK